jgi:hypothetical protein
MAGQQPIESLPGVLVTGVHRDGLAADRRAIRGDGGSAHGRDAIGGDVQLAAPPPDEPHRLRSRPIILRSAVASIHEHTAFSVGVKTFGLRSTTHP